MPGAAFGLTLCLVDEGSALPGIHLGEHAFHWDVEEVGVSDVGLAVGKGELFRLDHQVYGLRGVAPEPLNVELLDDVQLLQQDVAAGVWWRLEDGVAAICGGYGVLPLTVEAPQVFKGEEASVHPVIADNSCGNLAAVEDFCASVGDLFKGVGEVTLV